jgi:hypothetical protein
MRLAATMAVKLLYPLSSMIAICAISKMNVTWASMAIHTFQQVAHPPESSSSHPVHKGPCCPARSLLFC